MTTYPQIKGLRVKYLSADPSGAENGQVWYNSSTGKLRIDGILQAASWSSGGNYPESLRQNQQFGTSNTSAINAGGYANEAGTKSTCNIYNGTSWTGIPAMPSSTRLAGTAGTTTAGLVFGGLGPPTINQSWNGSGWTTSPHSLNVGVYNQMGCGTSTAAISAGGAGGSPYATKTEEYDGTGWTAGGNLPVARYAGSGNGILTSAIIAGGTTEASSSAEYDGSSWSVGGSMNSARANFGGSAGNSSNSNLIYGGGPPTPIVATELYNGTAWANQANMGTARSFSTGNGVASSALMTCGGPPGGLTNVTEEFTGATTVVKNLSVS